MSREIRGFQVDSIENGFIDNLNDSSIHSNWTQDAGSSTIVEDGADLTISNSIAAAYEWHSTFDSPNVNMKIEPVDFTAKVYVSGLTVASSNGGGIVHYESATKSEYHTIFLENAGANDSVLTRSNVDSQQGESLGASPGQCWLAMFRRGAHMIFYYSTNAVTSEPELSDMTFVRQFDIAFADYQYTRLALYAFKEISFPTINIEFRKFRLTYP